MGKCVTDSLPSMAKLFPLPMAQRASFLSRPKNNDVKLAHFYHLIILFLGKSDSLHPICLCKNATGVDLIPH